MPKAPMSAEPITAVTAEGTFIGVEPIPLGLSSIAEPTGWCRNDEPSHGPDRAFECYECLSNFSEK